MKQQYIASLMSVHLALCCKLSLPSTAIVYRNIIHNMPDQAKSLQLLASILQCLPLFLSVTISLVPSTCVLQSMSGMHSQCTGIAATEQFSARHSRSQKDSQHLCGQCAGSCETALLYLTGLQGSRSQLSCSSQ